VNDGLKGYPTGGLASKKADQRLAGKLGGSDCWYAAGQATAGSMATVVHTVDVLRLVPIPPFNRPMVITALGTESTAGGAGSVTRLGIYRTSDSSFVQPAVLMFDTGSLSTVGATVHSVNTTISVRPEFMYWAAVLTGVAAPTLRATVVANSYPVGHSSPNPGTAVTNSLFVSYAYSALPGSIVDTSGVSVIGRTSASIPLIFYRLGLANGA
jgi:hypothetical protein